MSVQTKIVIEQLLMSVAALQGVLHRTFGSDVHHQNELNRIWSALDEVASAAVSLRTTLALEVERHGDARDLNLEVDIRERDEYLAELTREIES